MEAASAAKYATGNPGNLMIWSHLLGEASLGSSF